jgi:ABC-type uncharacterized transport system involved in gliding motility auxiliary subunit
VALRSPAAASFGQGRRWLDRLNIALMVLLGLYCVAAANAIFFRHPWRIDLTREKLHTLSSETLDRLAAVREPVRVLYPYFLPRDGNPEIRAHRRVLDRARQLLKEYTARQPLIQEVMEVNVRDEPDRWKRLCDEYNLSPTQWNRFILAAGEGNVFRQTVTAQDLAVFAPSHDRLLAAPEVKHFRGEKALTGAILRLLSRSTRKVYFTQDRGELVLRSRKEAPAALVALRHDLEASGFEARELSLSLLNPIPDDCDLLVIAGPEQPFSSAELDVIERYLLRDGRLLVALGVKPTGIESLLERWGTEVRPGRLRMSMTRPGVEVSDDLVAIETFNAAHPITRPFQQAPHFEVRLWGPRPLKRAGAARLLTTDPLLETAESSARRRFFLAGGDEGASPGERERRGSFVLATATSQEAPDRPPPDWKPRLARIVVVAGASFVRDASDLPEARGGFLSFSHRDFFMNCVHWLVGEEEKPALGPVDQPPQAIRMTPGIERFLLLSSLVIFPGIFLCLGIFVYFLRRS